MDDRYITEEFFSCPACGEESPVVIRPGWNKIDCPYCSFYLIVFEAKGQRRLTSTPGVLPECAA